MSDRPRRTLPATELRVHLGAALRALAEEDIVIEKGGVPVALLTAYRPATASSGGPAAEYARSLSRAAEPGGWDRMDAAMSAGWAGIDADELVAKVYRWRAEGGMSPLRSPAEPGEDADTDAEAPPMEDDGDGEVPAGQRYLYQRHPKTHRVADGPGPGYSV